MSELKAMHEQIEAIHRSALDDSNADVLHRFIDDLSAERDQLHAELEDTRGRLGKSVVELSIAKAELSQERERVKKLAEMLNTLCEELKDEYVTCGLGESCPISEVCMIDDAVLLLAALSAGEGGYDGSKGANQ